MDIGYGISDVGEEKGGDGPKTEDRSAIVGRARRARRVLSV